MSSEDRWSQVRQTLREGFEFTVQKAEELTRLGRLKIEIASQKRKLARQIAELGARVYALMSENEERTEPVQADEQVKELLQRSAELESELQKLKDKYEEMVQAMRSSSVSEEKGETVDVEWELETESASTAEEAAEESPNATSPPVDKDVDSGGEDVDDSTRG